MVVYRLNPTLNIPSIIQNCLDGYATIDQALDAIRKILEGQETNGFTPSSGVE